MLEYYHDPLSPQAMRQRVGDLRRLEQAARDLANIRQALAALFTVSSSTVLHAFDIEGGRCYQILFGRKRFSAADPVAALLKAANKERLKWCPGCEDMHPVGCFAKDASRSDGLNKECRWSHAQRLRERRELKALEKADRKRQQYLTTPPN